MKKVMTIKEFLEAELNGLQVERVIWFRNNCLFWFAGDHPDVDSDAMHMISRIELTDQSFSVEHVGFVGVVDDPKQQCHGRFTVECRVEETTKRLRYWVFPNVRFVPRKEAVMGPPGGYVN